MITFKIFKESKNFYWSANKIYFCSLFFFLGLAYLTQDILKITKPFFGWTLIIIMILGLFYKFKGFTEIEPLRGTLEGDLIFEKESIFIANETFPLDEIHKIEISNDDYLGKLIHTSKGHIGPALSNGTNNFLLIFLKSKETRKIQFELINSNDFQKIKTILIEYYIKGKMEFEELSYVLGDKSRSEIRELKEEITKIRNLNKNPLSNPTS